VLVEVVAAAQEEGHLTAAVLQTMEVVLERVVAGQVLMEQPTLAGVVVEEAQLIVP